MGHRRVALLANPASGRGHALQQAAAAQEVLVAKGAAADVIMGSSPDEALRLARGAVADGYDTLVACGGDGTVSLALQAVAGSESALGILPVGTGNDIARALGIPRDLPAAAELIASGSTRRVDLAEAETDAGERRWFLGVLSTGFDSQVNERANRMSFPPGRARYLAAIAAELRSFEPVAYELTLDGASERVDGMLIAIGNGSTYGGGMRVCPSAVIDDGLLSVVVLSRVSKGTFLRVLPRVFPGSHVDHPAVTQRSARSVRVVGAGQVAYADGERIGELPVRVTVHPLAVTVIAPPAPAPDPDRSGTA